LAVVVTSGPGGSGYFGELLLRHRTAAGLSQRALARRSGLSERAVRDLERGATARPRQASVRAVAGALGLTGHNLVAFVAAAGGAPAEDTPSAAALSTRPLPLPGGLVGRAAELRVLFDLGPAAGTG
jgi:transcriptional regulator with XRE-family HTH domain